MENEAGLVARLSAGDLEAFDKLYWTYQDAVFRNAYKLLKDTELAEDVVQEVFIALWERREMLREDRSIAGWLFVTSYNRSVNALKKKLKERLALRDMSVTENADDPDLVIPEIQYQVLEKGIAGLSFQKRRVFELCKLQGRSYIEAAEILNISRHTVKEYLSSAVQYIREFARSQPDFSFFVLFPLLELF